MKKWSPPRTQLWMDERDVEKTCWHISDSISAYMWKQSTSVSTLKSQFFPFTTSKFKAFICTSDAYAITNDLHLIFTTSFILLQLSKCTFRCFWMNSDFCCKNHWVRMCWRKEMTWFFDKFTTVQNLLLCQKRTCANGTACKANGREKSGRCEPRNRRHPQMLNSMQLTLTETRKRWKGLISKGNDYLEREYICYLACFSISSCSGF